MIWKPKKVIPGYVVDIFRALEDDHYLRVEDSELSEAYVVLYC